VFCIWETINADVSRWSRSSIYSIVYTHISRIYALTHTLEYYGRTRQEVFLRTVSFVWRKNDSPQISGTSPVWEAAALLPADEGIMLIGGAKSGFSSCRCIMRPCTSKGCIPDPNRSGRKVTSPCSYTSTKIYIPNYSQANPTGSQTKSQKSTSSQRLWERTFRTGPISQSSPTLYPKQSRVISSVHTQLVIC
jgi:hypothetical protein